MAHRDPFAERFNRLQERKRDEQRDEQTTEAAPAAQPAQSDRVAGRNDPCPCGSGRKYKKCCGKAGGVAR